MIAAFISVLLRPKVLGGLLAGGALIALVIGIRLERRAYGKAQFKAGVADCRAEVAIKAAKDEAAHTAAIEAAKVDAAETETVYIEVTKEVAVTDAVIVAENKALKSEIETLNQRIDNAPIDSSACAMQPIPAERLRTHNEIDNLLAGH